MQPTSLYSNQFLILVFFLFASITCYGQDTYLDNFNSASYSNNNGSANFSSNWIESGDDGSASSGYIFVTGGELGFSYIWGENIRRAADLTGATSAVLSFDWRTVSLDAGESLAVQASSDGTNYTTLTTFVGTQTGTFSQDISAYISSNTTIRFLSGNNNWSGSGDQVYIDDFLITAVVGPRMSVDDETVDEDNGPAVFTVTHQGASASGAFTVNYTITGVSATEAVDYTTGSGIYTGTLSFDGTLGDSDTITVLITDDALYEVSETFTISFSSTSDPSVDISDTATGTIDDDEVILNDTPLVLFDEFNGYFDYAVTGGSFRDQSNTAYTNSACSIVPTSTVTGLTTTIPATATVEKAYLLWAHSNQAPDTQVTFEGQTVNADIVYSSSLTGNRLFYGMMSDVTTLVNGIANPSTNVYDVTNLSIDNTDTFASYCSTATTLGGWSLVIFYEELSLPAVSINMYHGFKGESNTSNSYTLDGFFAIGASGAKTTSLSWEGDSNLTGSSAGTTNPNGESLIVTNQAGTDFIQTGDGGQTGNNAYNSTIYDNTVGPVVNITNSYGVDLDTYDISSYISPADSEITVEVNAGQDFVMANMVLVKVPSNLIVGNVFEDTNYGGGAGRDMTTAGGVGVNGALVELYNNSGVFQEDVTTDALGNYSIGGMANGSYSIRVVNGSVSSNRGGGAACGNCLPIQTFRRNYVSGSGFSDITNEVGGADPSAEDANAGTLTNAQTISSLNIISEGVVGLDFGFNFNTIVNTNEDGQGSLEQFIVNSNALDETGLDIETNSIFDPTAGEDTSVFMIPPTGDALGRTADANFASGYFDISLTGGDQFTDITGSNTVIDGRTQTAYSGNTNSGTVGGGGTNVGTSATTLPNYDLPEIQIYRENGDVLTSQGSDVVIRNVALYANNMSGIIVNGGSATISANLLGVGADGVTNANIMNGVEISSGSSIIANNYITMNNEAGIWVNGGISTLIQNNHITANGDGPCDDNILVDAGTGVLIQQNLIEMAAGLGIDGDGVSENITITENTVRSSGQDGGICAGMVENAGIRLERNNSSITNNIISTNGGAGIVLVGSNTSGNLISQNSIYANGTAAPALGIDLDPTNGMGDGVTLNDTGDTDNGPNGAINFPIILAAYKSGSNVVVSGWSRPGATIEFFLTDVNQGTATLGDNQLGLSTDYGEGQVFLASVVEGSGADTDLGTSFYLDDDSNTDNTNKFTFTLVVPPTVTLGDDLTATATIANSTSEFSPFSKLKVYTVITNRRITYRVKKN